MAPQSEAVGRGNVSPAVGTTSLGKVRHRTELASQAQQAVWALDQSESGTAASNVTGTVHVIGALDARALKDSLASLVQRHEILRTVFLYRETGRRSGRLVQVISPEMAVDLPMNDLRGLPPAERPDAAQRIALGFFRSPFDLTRLPLFRVQVLTLDDRDHILHLLAHRLIMDEAAAGLFLRDLAVLYDAHSGWQSAALPPAQPYADIVNKELHRLGDGTLDAQLAFWTENLRGTLPVLKLPTDRSKAMAGLFRVSRETLTLPSALSTALRALSVREEVTIPILLLAAFNALLHRYTHLDDVLVGSVSRSPNRPEDANTLGPLDNVLVLRTDLSGDPAFRELLHRVRSVVETAHANRDVPFERILRVLRTNGSLASPLPFQIRFDLDRWLPYGFEGPELRATSVEIESPNLVSDVSVSVADEVEEISLGVRYNAELFAPGTIPGMLSSFRTLLEGIAARPDQCLSALPLLTDADRRRILTEWNDTATDYPRDHCVHQLFESQAERTPDRIAVVFEDRHLTYRQLNRRANQLAHHLRHMGVGPDVLVGVAMERSVELVVSLLAVFKAGGAYVPIDPDYPAERIAFMLSDAAATVLLTQQHLVDRLPAHSGETVAVDALTKQLERESETTPVVAVSPENLGYVIYTSGSTGRPKGCLNVHRGIVNRICWMQDAYQLDATDRVLQKTPFSFDVSVWEFFWTLMTGATLVMARPGGHRDPAYLAQLIVREGITTLVFVPSMLKLFLDEPSVKECLSLRRVMCSGEALSYDLQQRFFDHCAAELHNQYGPTETGEVTYWQCQRDAQSHIVPIGRPISNTQIYLLDKNLDPAPVGVAGELFIGGAGVGLGYLNRPELTAEKFLRDPFSDQPGMRMYRTGDLARYLPDGAIEYLGRIDHQVKIRGFRIELGEIETVLRSHGKIREAVVVLREDVPGNKRLVAYLAPSQEPSPGGTELRRFLKEKLPDYMIPSAFVMLDAFPLTPNGKVDRRMLPAPKSEQSETAPGFVAPRNSVEARLVKIWEEILGIHPIGVRDNYFDLGAESLQAAHVFARVSKRFGRALSPTSLFEAPTIEQQARLISQSDRPAHWSCLVPIQTLGTQSPLFCIHGGAGTILFFHNLAKHLEPDRPLYALQAQGLYDTNPPHTTVEQMAAHYIQEIRSVQPEGPYYVAGYCFGILVALEIAHRLESEGQTIAFLASINGTAPGYVMAPPGIDAIPTASTEAPHRSGDLRRVLSRKEWARARELLIGSARRGAFYLCRVSRLHGAYWRMISLIMKHYRSRQRYRPLPARIRNRFFLHNTFWAEREYRPRPYAGRLVIFRAKGLYHDPLLGWEDLVRGGIEVHEIPGIHLDHRNIVEEPAVGALAEHIRQSLLSQSARESKNGGSQANTEAGMIR